MEAWVVRAGGEGQPDVTKDFWRYEVAAIGWQIGDLSMVNAKSARKEIKDKLRRKYPDWGNRNVGQIAGNIYRFIFEISVGDMVVSPQPNGGSDVLVGYCAGGYEYRPDLIVNDEYTRKVSWQRKVNRQGLSGQLRRSLITALTVYNVSDHIEEIQNLLIEIRD